VKVIEGKLAIAVVDDDRRVLESLEDLLESAGYVVLTFTGPGALLSSNHSAIDCLITDIGMPVMDGFALSKAVRDSHPSLPVFMITGRYESGDQSRALSEDAKGFFRKPFDPQRLLLEVNRVLGGTHGG